MLKKVEVIDIGGGYYLKPYLYADGITRLRKYKKFCGVGILDADYLVEYYINGKRTHCPFYLKWCNMIKRCYYEKYRHTSKTYEDCDVCKEWLTFSNFKSWMEQQDWEGKQLDKDLTKRGNRLYSPDFCCFISDKINSLISNNKATGQYYIGVWYKKKEKASNKELPNPYVAEITYDGSVNKKIGYFKTPEEAHRAWQKEKCKILLKYYLEESNIKVAKHILDIYVKIKADYDTYNITKEF